MRKFTRIFVLALCLGGLTLGAFGCSASEKSTASSPATGSASSGRSAAISTNSGSISTGWFGISRIAPSKTTRS